MSGGQHAFGPAVRLRITGSARARSHFEREYGIALEADGPAVEVDLRFGWRPRAAAADGVMAGGHKVARWRVALGEPRGRPLRAAIALAGGPPGFVLSLVQGYYVEPLVAVALARSGQVALPSAGIAERDRAIVILGRSGSGKSSVTVRALARGRGVLGDDQLVVDAAGRCWPYPRRLRLYPDVRDTAPEGWTRLGRRTRAALELRGHVRRWSRGYVAPSLPVRASELGAAAPIGPMPAARLVVVERVAEIADVVELPRDADWAAERAADVLAEQRARLVAAADGRWRAALDEVAQQEAAVLRSWLAGLSITELRLPRAWNAPRAVAALATRLGIER